MKKILKAIVMLGIVMLFSFSAAQAATILFPSGGGTGRGTLPASQIIYGNGLNPVGSAATTTASCSGSASCTPFTVIGSSPVTISATGGTGGTGTVSTSTHETAGGLPYWTSTSGTPALLGQTSTSSISVGTSLTVTGGSLGYQVGGSAVTINAIQDIRTTASPTFAGATIGSLAGLIGGNAGNLYAIATSSPLNTGITGNAGTATALASTPTKCSAGNYPLGVDAQGNAQNCTAAGTGTVTAVTATYPLASSGGTTPNITTAFGTTTTWGMGNNGLVMTGSTGIPFSQSTSSPINLNISGNAATVTTNANLSGAVTSSGSNVTSFGSQNAGVLGTAATGVLTMQATSTLFGAAQNGKILGYSNGSLIALATTTFNSPLTYSAGAVSCASCLTANQTVTLTGVVTGSGSTAITTAFGTQNAGVLGSVVNGNTTAPLATSTLYGNGIGGQVLAWNNGVPQWVATSSISNGVSSLTAGNGISLSGSTGAVTVTNSIGYPFPYNNNTGTTSPLLLLASTTIGNGTLGLTVNGPATTTGNTNLATLSGRVGIGTSTPNWPLDIAGTRPSIDLSDTSGGTNLKHWIISSEGGNLYIGTSSDLYATTTRPTISIIPGGQSGWVGIGTSSPEAPLTIQSNSTGDDTPALTIDGSGLSNGNGDLELEAGASGSAEANIDFVRQSVDEWQLGIQNGGGATGNDFELWDGSNNPVFTVNHTSLDVNVGTTTCQGETEFCVWGDSGASSNILQAITSASSSVLVATNAGNVGVGTSTPTSVFSVNGGVTLHGLATGAGTGSICATSDGLLSFNSGANCIAGGGGGIGDPFTHVSVWGQTTSASSTLIALTGSPYSLVASSTVAFSALQLGSTTPQAYTNAPLVIAGNTNNFVQATISNLNSGNNASSDWVAGNNLSTNTTYYGDFGMNSSGYTQATYSGEAANDVFLDSSDSNLDLEAASTTGNFGIKFFTGGATTASQRMVITATGQLSLGTASPADTAFDTVASTSASAFTINDGFGTNDLNVQTASTTGPIFAVEATTTGNPILFSEDQYGHLTASSTGATPTISCTPSGGTLGAGSNDTSGDFTTGTLSTACTLTFAHVFSVAPEAFTGGGLITGQTRSTTAITFTFSAAVTGDDTSYLIVMP